MGVVSLAHLKDYRSGSFMRRTLFYIALFGLFVAIYSFVMQPVAVRDKGAQGRFCATTCTPNEQESVDSFFGERLGDGRCHSPIPLRQMVELACKTNRNTLNTTIRLIDITPSFMGKGFRINGICLLGLKKLPISYCREVPLFLALRILRN